MKASVEAVFQDGVFRPVDPQELPEGQRVRLTVEPVGHAEPEDVLTLASRVYKGLSQRDVDEIEQMARHRLFFNDVP